MKIKIRSEKRTVKSHNWLKTTKPEMFRSKTYTKIGDTYSYKIKPSEGSQSYSLSKSNDCCSTSIGSLNSLVFYSIPAMWLFLSQSVNMSVTFYRAFPCDRGLEKNPGALEMFTVLRFGGSAEGLQAHSWSPSSHPPTGVWSINTETLHHHELMSKKGPWLPFLLLCIIRRNMEWHYLTTA